MDHAAEKGLVRRFVRERDPTVGRTEVTEVSLTRSDSGPDGPVYLTVATFELPGS